jgi:hypothetical protein
MKVLMLGLCCCLLLTDHLRARSQGARVGPWAFQEAAVAGDGGPAMRNMSSLAVDRAGNVFVGERPTNRVRRIDATTGYIWTVAGTGNRGYGGDGGLATKADLGVPDGVALDSHGNLYIADRTNSRIRRVDAQSGTISTVAGTGKAGYTGDGGPATMASISYPFGIMVDRYDNVYIADTENHAVRKVSGKTGVIQTVAGTGKQGFAGDGGLATAALLGRPHNMVSDRDDNLIIGDSENQRIRLVDRKSGIISTIAGTGSEGSEGDGGPALKATFQYFGQLLIDGRGRLIVSTLAHRIRRIDLTTNLMTSVAGNGSPGFAGDGGLASEAVLNRPGAMGLDAHDNLYFVDIGNNRIRRIDAKTRQITTFAGPGQEK